MYPSTNIFLKRYANGVLAKFGTTKQAFYPFRARTVTAAGAVLPVKANSRYYVEDLVLGFVGAAGDAGTTLTVTGVLNGETVTVAELHRTASAVNAGNQRFGIGVLFDKGQGLTLTAANIADVWVTARYAEGEDPT